MDDTYSPKWSDRKYSYSDDTRKTPLYKSIGLLPWGSPSTNSPLSFSPSRNIRAISGDGNLPQLRLQGSAQKYSSPGPIPLLSSTVKVANPQSKQFASSDESRIIDWSRGKRSRMTPSVESSTDTIVAAIQTSMKRKHGTHSFPSKRSRQDVANDTLEDLGVVSSPPSKSRCIRSPALKTSRSFRSMGTQCDEKPSTVSFSNKENLSSSASEAPVQRPSKKLGLSDQEAENLVCVNDKTSNETAKSGASTVSREQESTGASDEKTVLPSLARSGTATTVSAQSLSKKSDPIQAAADGPKHEPIRKRLSITSFPSTLKTGCSEKRRRFPVFFASTFDIDAIQESREEFGLRGSSLAAYHQDREEALARVGDLFAEADAGKAEKPMSSSPPEFTTKPQFPLPSGAGNAILASASLGFSALGSRVVAPASGSLGESVHTSSAISSLMVGANAGLGAQLPTSLGAQLPTSLGAQLPTSLGGATSTSSAAASLLEKLGSFAASSIAPTAVSQAQVAVASTLHVPATLTSQAAPASFSFIPPTSSTSAAPFTVGAQLMTTREIVSATDAVSFVKSDLPSSLSGSSFLLPAASSTASTATLGFEFGSKAAPATVAIASSLGAAMSESAVSSSRYPGFSLGAGSTASFFQPQTSAGSSFQVSKAQSSLLVPSSIPASSIQTTSVQGSIGFSLLPATMSSTANAPGATSTYGETVSVHPTDASSKPAFGDSGQKTGFAFASNASSGFGAVDLGAKSLFALPSAGASTPAGGFGFGAKPNVATSSSVFGLPNSASVIVTSAVAGSALFVASTVGGLGGFTAAPSSKPSFSFGSVAATTTSAHAPASAAPTFGWPPSTQAFAFQTPAASIATASTSSNGAVNFGGASAVPSFFGSSASSLKAPVSASLNVFGGATGTSASPFGALPQPFSFAINTTPAPSALSTPAAASLPSASTNSFSTGASFNFPATSVASGFSFGPAASQTGISAAANPKAAFGSAGSTGFGLSSFPASGSAGGFGFQFGGKATAAPAFGSAQAAPQASSAFGAQHAPSFFGSASSVPSFGASTSSFGAPAAAFGSSNAGQTFGQTAAKPGGGFDFSAAIKTGPSFNFAAPGPSFASQQPISKPAPSFNFSVQPPTPSFGGQAASQAPTFGSTLPPAGFGTPFGTAPTPSFGLPQTPGYGGFNATPAQPAFGTASPAPPAFGATSPMSAGMFSIGGGGGQASSANRPTSRARRRLRK